MNVLSVKRSTSTQNLLSAAKLLGLICVFLVGLFVAGSASNAATSNTHTAPLGLALVFVLLTYGGWNEIAFASAEFRNVQRDMLRALLWGILIITTIFFLMNLSYLHALGLQGIKESDVVASDLMRKVLGEHGARFISLLIAVTTLGAISGTIFTGARTNYALGRSFAPLRFMGRWSARTNSPLGALLAQGMISLGLVLLGAWQRRGFETLVGYTAPVFWFFFLLAAVSLMVLRRKDPKTPRPFRVPFYPLTPILFCASCAYMLWSSLAYTGLGALAGVIVLAAGVVVLLVHAVLSKDRNE
jgi:amino acid transporter